MSVITFSQVWLFQTTRRAAALYKENQVKELSLYAVIFGIVKCYYCPVDFSVFIFSKLLWFVGVFLNLWTRLNSKVSRGKWLGLERLQKVTTFIEIIFQLKDKASDILHFIYGQQSRPKSTMCKSVSVFSCFPTPSMALQFPGNVTQTGVNDACWGLD